MKLRRKKSPLLLLMAIVPLLLVIAFAYVPLFGWVFAFFNYKPGVPLEKTAFVGLYFFQLIFTEGGSDFYRVLGNTLGMGLLSILAAPLPLILAILLNEVRSTVFKRLVQTTTTLPYFISWIIVYALAVSLFSSDGVLNSVLMKSKLVSEPLSIMGNSEIVWFFQTSLSVWKGLGWGAIIYLAAISAIDPELYEAAKVDGAGRFATIWHITVPSVASTFFVLLLLQIAGILSAGGLDQYLVFHNPIVAGSIETIDYYVYNVGIGRADYAYSTAVGIMKTVVSVVLLFSVNLLSRKVRGHGII